MSSWMSNIYVKKKNPREWSFVEFYWKIRWLWLSRFSEDGDVRCMYLLLFKTKVSLSCHCLSTYTALCKLYLDFWMQNSCYANKSDPHHLSLNQIEQKFSVVNKSEKIRPSHLVRREGGGFRKAIVLPHYLYVSPLVVPKPSFFFEPSF